MTAPELRLIVGEDVERDMKVDGRWPSRKYGGKQYDLSWCEDMWDWSGKGVCHPDDAAAQLTVGLMEWVLTNKIEVIRGVTYGCAWATENGWNTAAGPTLLHALVAAYTACKEREVA